MLISHMVSFKVGSMFAGIGGICLGFKQSGFDIVWANDFDADAIKTYKENFGDAYVVDNDIVKIDVSSIPQIDVLTAGFPCQPFSIAGKQKGFLDARGNLFFQIARVIEKKRPQVVFLENVANLVEHDNGRTFLVIYNTLVQFGYYVKYKVIDAQKYCNIPQHRERIFIVAFLNHNFCDSFSFPDEVLLTTKINDLIDRTEKHSDCYYYSESSLFYKDLDRIVKNRNGIYKINDNGVCKKCYSVMPTLMANMGTYPDRVPVLRDDFGIRKITPREALVFQGFPSSFDFGKGISLNSAYKQAGNSVCVPIINRIANRIKEILNS